MDFKHSSFDFEMSPIEVGPMFQLLKEDFVEDPEFFYEYHEFTSPKPKRSKPSVPANPFDGYKVFAPHKLQRNEVQVMKQQKTPCSICQTDFAENDLCALTSCQHLFHSSELLEWKKQCAREKKQFSCPVCRESLK